MRGPWGDPGLLEGPAGSCELKVAAARLAELAGLLELPQIRGPECLVVLPLALVTLVAGLPRPLECVMGCSGA